MLLGFRISGLSGCRVQGFQGFEVLQVFRLTNHNSLDCKLSMTRFVLGSGALISLQPELHGAIIYYLPRAS